MAHPIEDSALKTIFTDAHTHTAWLDKPVDDKILRAVYDHAKFGPTSANTSPARFIFVKTHAAKERLRPCLSPGNVDKTMAAPVCVIVAGDSRFYEYLPKLFPPNPKMADGFKDPAKADFTAKHILRNGSLQGAYFIIAARALGLDCGPMSGFDNAKLDAEFFPDGRYKSNFLCNLGYGDATKLKPRNPRLDFEEACEIL